MYVDRPAVAQGLHRLQIGMSFESDKSDSYFTRCVWRHRSNGAISLFPAEKTEGGAEAASFWAVFVV